jgi:hypothetical protein
MGGTAGITGVSLPLEGAADHWNFREDDDDYYTQPGCFSAPKERSLLNGRMFFLALGGWIAFGLGLAGYLPARSAYHDLWILAALAFLRTNRRMYNRIISHKRFGPGIRLFVEEGRTSVRGKVTPYGYDVLRRSRLLRHTARVG